MSIDWADLDKKNQLALKKVENGGTTRYRFTKFSGRGFLIIGDETKHKPANVAAMDGADKSYSGLIKVKKGGVMDAGTLTVSGCKSERSQFEDVIARFSKKKVIYQG